MIGEITREQFAKASFRKDQFNRLEDSDLPWDSLDQDKQIMYLNEADYYLYVIKKIPPEILDILNKS